MNCMEDLLKGIINEMKRDIPTDVCKDIEELAELKAELTVKLHGMETIDIKKVERINELIKKHYRPWEIEEKPKSATEPETFDFGEAIRRLKKGGHLARKGWNGKEQYIVLGKDFEYHYTDRNETKENIAVHLDIGSQALVFIGTRGAQVGWLASQADMLADDWYEVKKED